MARIPEAEIERLKSEVSVERLVEASGIELKKAGKDLLARCPFHEDDTASLVVTPGKNLWHCFGCGIGGGPIDWVIKRNGISFRHAVELLREGLPAVSTSASPLGIAAEAEPVKRSKLRALPAPVAFDADDARLLADTSKGLRLDRHVLSERQRGKILSCTVAKCMLTSRCLDGQEANGRHGVTTGIGNC